MPTEVRLPQLGQTMEEGTIVDYRVKVGNEVKKGDCIFEVETDKATLEVESPTDGFVRHIFADIGRTLRVGDLVLLLAAADEQVPQSLIDSLKSTTAAPAPPASPAQTAPSVPAAQKESPDQQPPPAKTDRRPIASPRAKRLAKELGVDLAAVTGSGPAGRITEQDVEKAAPSAHDTPPAAPPQPQLGRTIPLSKLQKITAQKMLQSKREIPCFYLSVKADVTELVELRTELNRNTNVKISYHDFIIRAVALGLEKFPMMTGRLAGDTIRFADTIDIGLAVSVPYGCTTPVIRDVSKKNLTQIARDTAAFIEKARSNTLTPAHLQGGSITVSNLGAFGADSFTPIIVPGQCSILGLGRITDSCVPDNGNIVVRKLMNMTLSVDHRITNGAYAAQFLDSVRKLLEDTSSFQ